MTNQVIDKDLIVLLATTTIACVLTIDGRLPWKQHDWSVTTYIFKMTILSLVFTMLTMFIPLRSCKRPGSPFLEKTLVVLVLTSATSWILMINGIPWKDNWSLFTYSCKVFILLLMVSLGYALLVHKKQREADTAMPPSDFLTEIIRFALMSAITIGWILKIDGRLPWEEEKSSLSVYYCKLGILMMVSLMTASLVYLRRY